MAQGEEKNAWSEFKRSIAKQRGRNRFAFSTMYRNMTDANAFNNPRNKEAKEKRQKQATVVCRSFRIARLS
eukprot:scaffold33655_cov137-Skeletonema_dohrnii-CCMP3373.AAC.5